MSTTRLEEGKEEEDVRKQEASETLEPPRHVKPKAAVTNPAQSINTSNMIFPSLFGPWSPRL
jgi:hypothetical protein